MALATAPSIIRIDMQDALRLPGGVETPPATPMVIFVKAPASWVEKGAITAKGKEAVLARLYGGPDWVNGNSDGSTYVVKAFSSKVTDTKELPASSRGQYWYEVDVAGALTKRGAGFTEPEPVAGPKSLVDSAIPGSVFKIGPALSDAKAALAFLEKHDGLVKLPATLKRGALGFETRGVKAVALTFHAEDSKLGLGLADRARSACADQKTCLLWLFGHWVKGAKEHTFDVTKVETMSGAMASMPEMTGFIWVP